jgi:Arc/MetJ-type ribon-helix-helix transcriptional regulator
MEEKEETIEVKLPKALVSELDELVKKGRFQTRSEILGFAARLIVLLEKKELPLSLQAEQYLYEEWEQKLRRMKNVSGS